MSIYKIHGLNVINKYLELHILLLSAQHANVLALQLDFRNPS